MRRTRLLVLIAFGAAVVGFAIASAAERRGGTEREPTASKPAPVQTKELAWRETLGPAGERLVFEVTRFQVVRDGWRADISVANESKVAFKLDKPRRTFGLMLFSSRDPRDFAQQNRAGSLPPVRFALSYDPALPDVLEPKEIWAGTISAHGALAAGSWVRIVFGELDPIGRAPDTFPSSLVWITDHAYHLQR